MVWQSSNDKEEKNQTPQRSLLCFVYGLSTHDATVAAVHYQLLSSFESC